MKANIKKEQIDEFNRVFHKMIRFMTRSHFFVFKKPVYDISPIGIGIIANVYRNPDIIIKEILDIMKIPNSTLSSAINRLEDMGLLKRAISKRDKRSYSLELTQEGLDAMSEHARRETDIFGKMLNALDEEERVQIIKLMDKMMLHLGKDFNDSLCNGCRE